MIKRKSRQKDLEYDFILRFATGKVGEWKFDNDINKHQLRGLWTAYCIHNADRLQIADYLRKITSMLASMIDAGTYTPHGKYYWLAFESFMSECLPEKFREATSMRVDRAIEESRTMNEKESE